MRNTFKTLTATVALSAALLPPAAQAAGFYLQEQSVRGIGRAFSGEVSDQGSQSLWWNPAAIGGTQNLEGSFGISAILPSGNVNNIGTMIVRPSQAPAAVGGTQSAHNPIENGVLPSGAIAFGLTPWLAAGVSVTAPYSFTTNYDSANWARYTARQTKLRTYDIQPTLAFAPSQNISLGIGLNIERAAATLSNSLPNLSSQLPDGYQSLQGSGWDTGWSAGVQYHDGPLSMGMSYKSSIKHKLDGTVTTSGLLYQLAAYNGTLNANAAFRTPWQANFGARYSVTPDLTLNGQITRFGWSEFSNINVTGGVTAAIPENYRDTWTGGVGLDYAVTPDWTLRTGVQYDQTPTRNGQRDARVPDANRWNLAAGTSYKLSSSLTLDAAASYIAFANSPINRTTAAFAGTAAQTPILVNGQLDGARALTFSLGVRFNY